MVSKGDNATSMYVFAGLFNEEDAEDEIINLKPLELFR